MQRWQRIVAVSCFCVTSLLAQAGEPPAGQQGGQPGSPPGSQQGSQQGSEPVKASKPAAATVDAGRQAIAQARTLLDKVRGLRGAERVAAIEAAATAFDKAVEACAAEPKLAAAAAFQAAGAWRQHGSLAVAEKAYLLAAQLDASRYGARAVLGAADMQRRQNRGEEAFASYVKVTELEPGSGSAQEARLWQARMLQDAGKIDEAIATFQVALESARPGRDTIDTANHLALAWIEKGDLEAAGFVLEHAEEAVAGMGEEDPAVVERLRKALEAMSARRALQRALDKRNGAAKDAVELDRAKGATPAATNGVGGSSGTGSSATGSSGSSR